MAPAVALAIPQYTHVNDKKEGAEFTMDSTLDFDLLAEYLLEDVEAGGFDFSDVIGGDMTKGQQAVSSLPHQDPGGIVTVTPNGSTSFVDPLITQNVTAQLQQPRVSNAYQAPTASAPLPASGDMSGELSQVQKITMEMVAHQQEQAKTQITQPPTTTQPLNSISKPLVNGVGGSSLAVQPPPNKRPRTAAQLPVVKGANYSFASSKTVPPTATAASQATRPAATVATAGTQHDKSQVQLDRRRERNRILARRTRLRKKFFFESLQTDVADLQRENASLKSIVRSRLKPDDARTILSQCNANERLPSTVHSQDMTSDAATNQALMSTAAVAPASDVGAKQLDREDFSLMQSIQNSQQCFIITDPSLHDNPIVYASNDFLTLTGYSQEEVLGRNCRFLQGTETNPDKVAQIRKAISVGEDVNVTIANYTSSGKPFWNQLFIAALRDADNNIVNFIGVIVKVASPEKGDSEYGKILK